MLAMVADAGEAQCCSAAASFAADDFFDAAAGYASERRRGLGLRRRRRASAAAGRSVNAMAPSTWRGAAGTGSPPRSFNCRRSSRVIGLDRVCCSKVSR